MERNEALEALKKQIMQNIMDKGIDEGYNLEFILNEELEEEEKYKKEE